MLHCQRADPSEKRAFPHQRVSPGNGRGLAWANEKDQVVPLDAQRGQKASHNLCKGGGTRTGVRMDRTSGWNQATYQVQVENKITLEGNLSLPENPRGVVLFAHGSGSSRHSPRNQFVAQVLHEAGFATLGASTGAAAALVAAAMHPLAVGAVVSRGGRPDLAGSYLPAVQAPTLLLVGSKDTQVIELNRRAFSLLRYEKQLEIIPGASHLFEEPGTLEKVAQLASQWFTRYLAA